MDSKPLLKNMRILDFTRVLSGPFATMMLGDLGAEVIKIEPPNGDESRVWPPIMENGTNAYFLALNRNKRSLVLNLKAPEAREIVARLAAQARVGLADAPDRHADQERGLADTVPGDHDPDVPAAETAVHRSLEDPDRAAARAERGPVAAIVP